MPVLAELEPLLERIRAAGPPDPSLPVAERRAQVHAGIDAQAAHLTDPVPEAPHADHPVRVDGGEITVRLYRPEGEETLPCHVFVHGGERLAAEIAGYCAPERRREAYASPLLAEDLGRLPPTRVATAGYDLLRDDGERYAARLHAAGVPATHVCWDGHIHGSLGMTRLLASAHDWHERNHAFLREHLSPRYA